MTEIDLAPARTVIEEAWPRRDALNPKSAEPALRDAVDLAIDALDRGRLRAAEPSRASPTGWVVNEWAKKAILLGFRLLPSRVIGASLGGPARSFDKLPLKTADWEEQDFLAAGFRAVPPTTIRRGAFVAEGAVVMPSYINVGAYVDKATMVDTWVTIGSCAQIGANCHISGGVGIGGVLEPLQASPVIIEDGCFIGARSEVAEGVVVREGSVLGMGVYLGQSTPIINRATGETLYGEVPPFSVVVAGARPGKPMPGSNEGPSLYCAVIVKQVDAKTRAKTGVNELLRD
jgi:2,3,4,5-tetrahydropyridine-2-carboxylate N-succinyltransferase